MAAVAAQAAGSRLPEPGYERWPSGGAQVELGEAGHGQPVVLEALLADVVRGVGAQLAVVVAVVLRHGA
ncbi:MAG: hypothetical protein M3Q82_04430, partial [Actinomycetota bacterium]|nr:hypothetical protein [Actinomycetota bacterium]